MRESAAAQLQVILDHVKDAILTVDEAGRIETLNSIGERVFGYEEETVRGRTLDVLIPSLARRPRLTEALEELAESLEDTTVDLTPRETKARRKDGTLFDAELGVSKVKLDRREVFIVCLRDTSDRKRAEAAIRESEARYRTLVENAPEAIVVFDVDLGRFVECNDNAVRFFKMTREELLASGPERVSPNVQADGTPSFGVARGHIDRALAGEAPCFEWTHCDASGHEIPCEVRLVRLPSSSSRLVRGSITDITERKRAEFLAMGERRVFERITSNVDLPDTLEAIAETAERVTPDALCAVTLYDARQQLAAPGRRSPPAHAVPACARERRGRRAQRILCGGRVPAAPGHRRRDHPRRALGAAARARAHGRPARLLVHADPRLRRPRARHAWRCTSTSRAARCAATSN